MAAHEAPPPGVDEDDAAEAQREEKAKVFVDEALEESTSSKPAENAYTSRVSADLVERLGQQIQRQVWNRENPHRVPPP